VRHHVVAVEDLDHAIRRPDGEEARPSERGEERFRNATHDGGSEAGVNGVSALASDIRGRLGPQLVPRGDTESRLRHARRVKRK
jgi:hypothetical protein